MSGGEFEAEIRNGIRQLQSNVDGLTKSIGTANKATKDLGKEANKSFKEAGEAIKRVGGPLGEVIGRLGGSTGMSGGLARVAAGAALLGIAFKATNAVMDANLDRTRKLIEATHELEDAQDKAAKARDSHALGAAQSQGGDLRRLVTRGGRTAVEQAEEIAGDKSLGIDAADARRGVAASFTLPAEMRDQRAHLINAAKQVAAAGEASFSEAVEGILADPELLARLKQSFSGDDVARRLVVKKRGQDPTQANIAQAGLDISGRTAELQQGGKGIAGQVKEVVATIAGEDATGRKEIENGTAVGAARKQAAAIADPVSAALVELAVKQNRTVEDLKRLSEDQGKVMGLMADIFQPGGSFETQLERIANGRAKAAFGPGG